MSSISLQWKRPTFWLLHFRGWNEDEEILDISDKQGMKWLKYNIKQTKNENDKSQSRAYFN